MSPRAKGLFTAYVLVGKAQASPPPLTCLVAKTLDKTGPTPPPEEDGLIVEVDGVTTLPVATPHIAV